MPSTDLGDPSPTERFDLINQLQMQLLERYGPLLGGTDLPRALGFPNARAFQQAVRREVVEVPVFAIAGRRGKFALTTEVARWIATQRLSLDLSAVDPRRKERCVT